MNNYYLSSSSIKVYPTSRRDDSKDRNARLYSEQNIVSLINRLTSQKSFIININLTDNKFYGDFNLDGYLFTIPSSTNDILDNRIDIGDITGLTGNSIYICTELVESTTTPKFKEIKYGDDRVASEYRGFWLTDNLTTEDLANTNLKYLEILTKINNVWTIKEDSKLIFDSSIIRYNTSNNNSINNINNAFILDDGELSNG